MYLLFVDESGTHGGSHAFVLGGLAVHEDDAAPLQRKLDELIIRHLGRVPPNLDEFELHASEMRNAKKPERVVAPVRRPSIWGGVSRSVRNALLKDAYEAIASFSPSNPSLPVCLFGVVVDSRFRQHWTGLERERFSYEVLLNKFDVMLKRLRIDDSLPNRGLVIHDERVLAEKDIQAWTAEWRAAAGTIGQLHNLADVPLFTDSRATRLLQAADLVSYALFRRYAPAPDGQFLAPLWHAFARADGRIHGCVHYSPSYGQGTCECEACEDRLLAEAAAKPSTVRKRPRTQPAGAKARARPPETE